MQTNCSPTRLGMSKLQWAVLAAAGPPRWEQGCPVLVPSSQLSPDSSSVLEAKADAGRGKGGMKERSNVQLEGIFAMLTSQGCLIIGLIC